MQDRLKSRFFHKPSGKYLNSHSLVYCNGCYEHVADRQLPNGTYKAYILATYNTSEIIEEQCTGLKDKNGKLIYEGDIVEKVDTNAIGYTRIRDCRIFWHDKWLAWAIETEFGDVYMLEEFESEQYEIISNIHEENKDE